MIKDQPSLEEQCGSETRGSCFGNFINKQADLHISTSTRIEQNDNTMSIRAEKRKALSVMTAS